ncbi:hypothetical protein [Propionibacterium australiense]|uniref:Uncharacterized protein n=1 Tax=Propionibacterium australiense TaxID=119981 RepID=A0A8B3GHY4_9ACTN|nr:hypothetical protein [Propionibacterium australiense]RLP12265.1 hypothetical protein D7U36_03120 [Propionibacterium australiense]
MASQTRAAAVKAGAKLPQDHAAAAEAQGRPVKAVIEAATYDGGADLTVAVPRDLVDSYEAVNAVYTGFVMPVMQALDETSRQAVLDAAADETGKVRNSVVQRILVAALTQAAQGE